MTREEMFERNFVFARRRLLQMIENPEQADFIPESARVISLPRGDPELLEANLEIVLQLARNGNGRPIVLIPEVQ